MTSKLLAYAQLTRIPAVFTALSNILAAHFIATEGQPQWMALAISLLSSACLYCGGMVLNDCFDLAIDQRERPTRPLPSGRISPRHGWIFGWGLLISGIGLSALVTHTSLLVAGTLAACIVLYNSFAKHNALGPSIMASCRYLNWLLGFSVVTLNAYFILIPLPIFAYIMGLTLLSQAEVQAKDPKILSASYLMILTSLLFLAWLIMQQTLENHGALIPAILGVILLTIHYVQTYRHFTPPHIQTLMRTLILGIIPLDAIVTLSADLPLAALGILILLLPSRWLAKRIYVT